MIDRLKMDLLLDEVATTAAAEPIATETLERLSCAFRDDADFARRGAELLLTTKRLTALATVEGGREFVPPRKDVSRLRRLLPAAALAAGICLGLLWPEDKFARNDPVIPGEPKTTLIEIDGPLWERTESRFAYSPHQYEDGLLAGKKLRIELTAR